MTGPWNGWEKKKAPATQASASHYYYRQGVKGEKW